MKIAPWTLCVLLLATTAWAEPRIQVKALLGGQAMLIVDGKTRMLKAGQTSPEGVTLVSADSFGAVIEFDGQQRELKLDASISNRAAKKTSKGVVQIPLNAHGSYIYHGQINGKAVKLVVDTGATSVALNSIDAQRLGVNYQLHGKPMMASTASGYARGWHVTLDTVRVGNIEKRNVRAAVIDGAHPSEVLLGMTFLESLDIRNQGGYLELRER